MSTNYYVRPPGAEGEGIHLGKRSGGWAFMFRAYPDTDNRPAGITWDVIDYDSWLRLLDLGPIVNEYGDKVSKQEMVDLVAETKCNGMWPSTSHGRFRDDQGNVFSPYEFC